MHNSKIAALFAQQDGVISRRQALDHGMTDEQIYRRIKIGAWRRLFDGVYFTVAHRMSHEARLRAAVFASGSDAVAWSSSAAWWHGLIDIPSARPQVTVPKSRQVRTSRQLYVRRRDLDAADCTTVRGLPVTTLEMTVLDAAMLPGGSVLVDQALQGRVQLDELNAVHARNGKRVGAAVVGQILAAAADGSRSAAEKLLHRVLRDARIIGWRAQVQSVGFFLDAAFVPERLGIEIDGWRFRADPHCSSRDLERQNSLVNAGWHILRYDWHRLSNDPEGVVREIRIALATRVGKVS